MPAASAMSSTLVSSKPRVVNSPIASALIRARDEIGRRPGAVREGLVSCCWGVIENTPYVTCFFVMVPPVDCLSVRIVFASTLAFVH